MVIFNKICTLKFASLFLFQSILIHRNSGFRGVGVPFNCKLGSKICKKIFETWRRCNFSSCIFLAVDRSWQMSTSKTRPRLMGFVNFLIFFVFFAKIVIFYWATAKIAPFNSAHQDLSIGTFSAFGRTNQSNHYQKIEIFRDFPYLQNASLDRHVYNAIQFVFPRQIKWSRTWDGPTRILTAKKIDPTTKEIRKNGKNPFFSFCVTVSIARRSVFVRFCSDQCQIENN